MPEVTAKQLQELVTQASERDELFDALQAIVDAQNIGDGGRHVGEMIVEAQALMARIKENKDEHAFEPSDENLMYCQHCGASETDHRL